jgi:hypothetical protein
MGWWIGAVAPLPRKALADAAIRSRAGPFTAPGAPVWRDRRRQVKPALDDPPDNGA